MLAPLAPPSLTDKDAISATMLEQLAPIIADPQFTFAEGFSAMVACVCAFVRALYDYAVKHRNGTGAPSKSSGKPHRPRRGCFVTHPACLMPPRHPQ